MEWPVIKTRKMAQNNKHKEAEPNAVENLNAHLTQAGSNIQKHKKTILWVVGIIVLAGAFAGSYLYFFRNPKIDKSWEEYSAAYVKGMEQQSDSVLLAGMKKVADKYNGSYGGAMAALQAGEQLYAAGKYQDALKYLQKADIDEPVLATSALRLTGDCYVNLKQYDKALSVYNDAVKAADGNPQIAPGILMKEANIYEAQKKYAQALEVYEQIKKDYPEFHYVMGMDAYIARAKARLGK